MSGNGWLRPVAVGVSLALHAAVLWQFSGSGSASASYVAQPVRQVHITRLNLVAPAPLETEPLSDIDPAPDTELFPDKEPVQPKPQPVKPMEKKSVASKVPSSKPDPRPKNRSEQPKKIRPTLAKAQHQQAAQKAVPAPPAIDKGLIAEARQRYLAMVMAHIEGHKFYPSTARRRGIQGDVHISFLLLADGTTRQVVTEGASKLLQKAAKKAVIQAIPMPKPPVAIHCPMHCEFAMRYALK